MAYYIASCSCGNDSMAMVQELVRRKYPLDEIVFYSNGMDFQAIYKLWEWVKHTYEPMGIKCKLLEPDYVFTDKMFNIEVKNRDGSGTHKGYSWCGGRCRWGTTDKIRILDGYCESKSATVYVGIAADEQYRLERQQNQKENVVHPLADWGITEADCLKYCYDHGFDWDGLYVYFKRVSCWCCPLQGVAELRQLYKHFPDLWEKLKYWDSCTWRKFRSDYSVLNLETRFRFEEEWKATGKPTGTREYYQEMRKYIKESENGK